MVKRFKFASSWNGGDQFIAGKTYVLASEVDRLLVGLDTIHRYTGNTRHPNGVWDAHVIAERLLRGEDQNGRSPASGESEHG